MTYRYIIPVYPFSPTDKYPGCCTAEVSAIELVPTEALDKDAATKMLSELSSAPKESDWDKSRNLLM